MRGLRVFGFGGGIVALALSGGVAMAASPAVQGVEDSVWVGADYLHTQYHENLSPGDDESGYMPGFSIGAGALLPLRPGFPGSLDLYSSFSYDFNADSIKYAGHYQSGGALDASDRAVVQRIEARIGLGFPLADGGEAVPFLATGYQAWNRNVDSSTTVYGGEFYHAALFGGGVKLDVPVAPGVVVSGTGEVLAVALGGITGNGINFGGGFGVTPEERFEVRVDDRVSGRWHVFGKAFLEHFNYAGTRPEYFSTYYIYEPFSTTTQFGVGVGVAYSFF